MKIDNRKVLNDFSAERRFRMKTKLLIFVIVAIVSLSLSLTGVGWGAMKAPRTQSQVKQVTGPPWTTIPSSADVLSSISASPPGKGYLIVTATGTVSFTHTAGTPGYYCLDLSETENDVDGCGPMSGSDSGVRSRIPANFPSTGSSDFGVPFTIVKVYEVTDSSTRTFYLNGYATDLDSAYLFHAAITVLFVPAALP